MAIEAMEIEAMAQRPGRDIVTPIVTVAAILLFLAVGGVAFSRIVATYVHNAAPPERALTVALILNIALILFGWRRHTALSHERSEEHTSELQSLMRISYAVFCLKKKTDRSITRHQTNHYTHTTKHSKQ